MLGRAAAACLAIVALAADAAAEPAPPPPSPPSPSSSSSSGDPLGRAARVSIILGAIGLFTISETFAKDALAPDRCRWCAPGELDDGFREVTVWDDPILAKHTSDLVGYGVAPLAASALLYAAGRDRRGVYVDDMIAAFEAVWAIQLATQIVKISVARQRPYARYRTEPAPADHEDNLSFFSGHSSLTFSIAVATGTIASRRGYRLAPVVWGSGLALAATTAYLRMAADRHYFTDVLVGAAVGAAGGALLPRLYSALPAGTALAPTPGGVALTGSF